MKEKLEKIANELNKGELLLLGGRPGTGKTTVGLSLALNKALSNEKVVIFSTEIDNENIIKKMVSNLMEIDLHKLQNGELDNEELEKYEQMVANVKDLNIIIEDKTNIAIEDIKAKCKDINDLSLVVIDYLQLVSVESETWNGQKRDAYIVKELKLLAQELNTSIIVLSQLPREVSGRQPVLSDLKVVCGENVSLIDKVIFLNESNNSKISEDIIYSII